MISFEQNECSDCEDIVCWKYKKYIILIQIILFVISVFYLTLGCMIWQRGSSTSNRIKR